MKHRQQWADNMILTYIYITIITLGSVLVIQRDCDGLWMHGTLMEQQQIMQELFKEDQPHYHHNSLPLQKDIIAYREVSRQ